DAGVRGGETYFYSLKTVTADGRESPFSDERYIRVPVTGGGLPVKPPEWVGALIDEHQIKLAWQPSASSSALAYNIYRSREKDKGFQLIGSTQDTSLTDTDVKDGETYYYALTTLDKEFKETRFSEVKSVTYTLPEAPHVTGTGGGREVPGKKGGEAGNQPQEKVFAKPTRIIGYIVKGKEDRPLLSPTDIDIGPNGNLYVTDTGNSTIEIFTPGGEPVRAIGGPGTKPGKFQKLLGLKVDEKGYIYAVDAYQGRIQKFDGMGHLLMEKKMAEDGKAIAQDLGLKQPVTIFGIVKPIILGGNIYLLDNCNNCIEMYSRTGTYIKTFGGKGVTDGKLQCPTFAAVTRDGELLVSDCLNARVQAFDKDGKFLWNFGSYGNIVGSFSRPKGISIDGSGRIYVADSMSNVIQVFDRNGEFLFLLGDERGKQIDLGTPNGIAIDKRKRIYMVEKLINRIQIRQVGE
ncbi:MAG: 6-bladed beta-propeller, partial [Nitrospirota bacterium]